MKFITTQKKITAMAVVEITEQFLNGTTTYKSYTNFYFQLYFNGLRPFAMSDLECVAVHVHKQTLLTITNVNFASKKIFVTDETFLLS